jgi:predicted metal-dependent peptidase
MFAQSLQSQTVEQRLAAQTRRMTKINISIMRDDKFALWSGFLSLGSIKILDKDFTARTNGIDEEYSLSFIETLTDKELAFVRLHEMLHKAFKHLKIYQKLYKEDAECANKACDYLINYLLWEADPQGKTIALPKIALFDHKYRGLNSKQIYDLLRKQKQQQQQQQQQQGQGTPQQGQGQAQGEPSLDEHMWDEASGMSDEDKKKIEEQVDAAVRQGIIAHNKKNKGEGAGGMYRALQEVLMPQVDWREQLREFVKQACPSKSKTSWRKINRRMLEFDVYMPILVGEKMKDLVVAVDTSGSIGEKELGTFLAEIKSICEEVRPSNLHLLYWDTRIANHETYTESNLSLLTTSTKPQGGGGTAPNCIAKYMKEKHIDAELCIVFTDGYVGSDWGGPAGDWVSPVLWAISDNEAAVPAFGTAIHIKSDK